MWRPHLTAGAFAGAASAVPGGPAARAAAAGPAFSGYFNSVAPTSASDAWAIGYTGPRTYKTLIARWNGTSWARVPSPSPARHDVLFGVAATSVRSAWAVGVADNPGSLRSKTLILRWTGRAWTRVPSPAPGAGGTLNAVATTSARNAWTVGFTGSNQSLLLHWNGAAWTHVTSPAGARASSLMFGVGATSARDVWAVGDTLSGGMRTLILHWNGTAWK
jgi:hypothetical protein